MCATSSADDVRIVLEPKSRNVDADMMMEHLFRQTDLEVRVGLNMNVLDASGVPRVMTLKEVLRAFLDHRHDVLIRRSKHRLGKIEHRLEMLDGYLIAFLNLDEVIRIIREEDDPKAELMRTFDLTEVQAEAILNMRLRNLRKLEEMEIKREHDQLTAERTDLMDLLADEGRRWATLRGEVEGIRERFGKATALGERRTRIGAPPTGAVVPLEAFVEREPITRLPVGERLDPRRQGPVRRTPRTSSTRKATRSGSSSTPKQPTSCWCSPTTAGSTPWPRTSCPRGRGFGEPIRLMTLSSGSGVEIVALRRHDPEGRLMVASGGRPAVSWSRKPTVAAPDPRRQAGAQPRGTSGGGPRAGPGPSSATRCRRHGGGAGQEPQIAGVPARPRCRRWPAAGASSCRNTRTAAIVDSGAVVFRLGEGPALGPAHPDGGGPDPVPRQTRPGRSMVPKGFPKANRFG